MTDLTTTDTQADSKRAARLAAAAYLAEQQARVEKRLASGLNCLPGAFIPFQRIITQVAPEAARMLICHCIDALAQKYLDRGLLSLIRPLYRAKALWEEGTKPDYPHGHERWREAALPLRSCQPGYKRISIHSGRRMVVDRDLYLVETSLICRSYLRPVLAEWACLGGDLRMRFNAAGLDRFRYLHQCFQAILLDAPLPPFPLCDAVVAPRRLV